MNAKLLNYFGEILPEKCGYSGSHLYAIGSLVELIYEQELEETYFLSAGDLEPEERAQFALPYPPKDDFADEYAKGLYVATVAIINHRRVAHGEYDEEDMIELMEGLDEDEREVVEAAGVWDH